MKDHIEKILNSQASLKEIKNKIVGGVASFPKRIKVLEQMVNSILPQVDELIVYLNNYEEIPAFLIDSRITVFRSQDLGDISANGKVYHIDKLKSCYFFSLDDDIEYPDDYVDKMIACLKKYDNMVGVAVHGSIFPGRVQWYFERYSLYSFVRGLKTDKFVTLIGSGTLAFHTDTLKAKFSDFCGDVMVDLRFSILAREQRVPLVCIARPKRWLKALVPDEGLYQENLKRKTYHTTVAVECNPWSYEVYKSIIQPVVDVCFRGIDDNEIRLLKLDEQFIASFKDDTVPENWKETGRYWRNVEQRKAVFDPSGFADENRMLEKSQSFAIRQLISRAVRKPGINTIRLPYLVLKHVMRKVL